MNTASWILRNLSASSPLADALLYCDYNHSEIIEMNSLQMHKHWNDGRTLEIIPVKPVKFVKMKFF